MILEKKVEDISHDNSKGYKIDQENTKQIWYRLGINLEDRYPNLKARYPK